MSVSFAKSALAALTAAAILVPAAASAQSYGGYGGQSYGYDQGYGQRYDNRNPDRCRTLGQGRTGAGALIGGGIGAVAGSQIAARGNRTEGSIIGGVLGALIGSQVGRASNDQCRSDNYRDNAYAPPAQYYSDRDRYDDRASSSGRYDERGYDDRRYEDRRYDDRGGYEVSADGHYFYDPDRGWLPR
jgi:hypothetical protein